MENRVITIVSTANSSKVEVETNASTLGELKSALRNAGVDYEGMTFYEGLTKIELVDDASLLPHDVMRNGQTTNNLVFMLTNTNKKIKSGATRTELYQIIKVKGLTEACKEKYGKNFTMCKTADLEALVAESTKGTGEAKSSKATGKTVDKPKEWNCAAAIEALVDILYNNDCLSDGDCGKVLQVLKGEKSYDAAEEESGIYSNAEINGMFDFLK